MEVTHYVDTRTFKNQRQAGPAGTLLAFLLDLSGAQLCRAGRGRVNSGSAAQQAVSTVTDDTTAYDIVNSIPDSMLGAILVGMLIGSIAALCWALFVVYPLNVGRCRYFHGEPPVPDARLHRRQRPSAAPTATPSWCSCLPT